MIVTGVNRREIMLSGLVLGLTAVATMPKAQAATEQEAKDMVARAIKLFGEQGEAALGVFNQGEAGGFLAGELYIVVQSTGPDAKVMASAADPKLVGIPLAGIADAEGDHFAVRMSAEATEEGSWFYYQWMNPAAGKVMRKKAWAVRYEGLIFICGIYE